MSHHHGENEHSHGSAVHAAQPLSILCLSAGARLGGALVMIIGLWAVTGWALGG